MTERPTAPPGPSDLRAAEFDRRLTELQREGRRPASGLFRALAEAWVHLTKPDAP